jgi:hypothetical protein
MVIIKIHMTDDNLCYFDLFCRSPLVLACRPLDSLDVEEEEVEGFFDGSLCGLSCLVCPLCRCETGGLEHMVHSRLRVGCGNWKIHRGIKKIKIKEEANL